MRECEPSTRDDITFIDRLADEIVLVVFSWLVRLTTRDDATAFMQACARFRRLALYHERVNGAALESHEHRRCGYGTWSVGLGRGVSARYFPGGSVDLLDVGITRGTTFLCDIRLGEDTTCTVKRNRTRPGRDASLAVTEMAIRCGESGLRYVSARQHRVVTLCTRAGENGIGVRNLDNALLGFAAVGLLLVGKVMILTLVELEQGHGADKLPWSECYRMFSSLGRGLARLMPRFAWTQRGAVEVAPANPFDRVPGFENCVPP